MSRAWKKAYIKFSPTMTFIREKPNDRRHQPSSVDNEIGRESTGRKGLHPAQKQNYSLYKRAIKPQQAISVVHQSWLSILDAYSIVSKYSTMPIIAKDLSLEGYILISSLNFWSISEGIMPIRHHRCYCSFYWRWPSQLLSSCITPKRTVSRCYLSSLMPRWSRIPKSTIVAWNAHPFLQ